MRFKTVVRYSDANDNWEEALKGYWGNQGEESCSVTIMKSVIFINLYKGAKVTDFMLPEVYDGFIQLSNGNAVPVTDNKFSCNLPDDVTGFGILKMRKNI